MKKILPVILVLLAMVVGGCVVQTSPKLEMPPSLAVYGTLSDINTADNVTIFKIESQIVNCELNSTVLEIKSNKTIDITNLTIGEKYAFGFIQINAPYWDLMSFITELNLTGCQGFHERDLQIKLCYEPGSRGCGELVLGNSSQLSFTLLNNQDYDLLYEISNINLSGIDVSTCSVTVQNGSISTQSSKNISFDVLCSEPTCNYKYTLSEQPSGYSNPYVTGIDCCATPENCTRFLPDGKMQSPNHWLSFDLTFEDELELQHKIPGTFTFPIIWQNISHSSPPENFNETSKNISNATRD